MRHHFWHLFTFASVSSGESYLPAYLSVGHGVARGPGESWVSALCQFLVLASQCDVLVEEFEEVIEDWYRNHQEEDLTEFLCANHVLKGKDTSE